MDIEKSKLDVSREFEKGLFELIAKSETMVPNDQKIKEIKELILTARATDPLIITIEAGSLFFKYRTVYYAVKDDKLTPRSAIGQISELKGLGSTKAPMVNHVIGVVFFVLEKMTEAEKKVIYAIIDSMIINYAKFLKLERMQGPGPL
jgi:hypothetical protein